MKRIKLVPLFGGYRFSPDLKDNTVVTIITPSGNYLSGKLTVAPNVKDWTSSIGIPMVWEAENFYITLDNDPFPRLTSLKETLTDDDVKVKVYVGEMDTVKYGFFREHRGGLAESLATTEIIERGLEPITRFLNERFSTLLDRDILPNEVLLTDQGFDKRLGHSVTMLSVDRLGVVGYLDDSMFVNFYPGIPGGGQ